MQIALFIWLVAITIIGLYFAIAAIRLTFAVLGAGLKAMTEGDRRIREAYGLEEPTPKRIVSGNVIHTTEFGRR
jgi:hypothetical protein